MRISASLLPNMYSASFSARYVLPTPVGPINMNVPMGLLGSLSPIRLRMMALTSFSMASFCSTTVLRSASLRPFMRMLSDFAMRCTGTPLISETVFSTSSRVTVLCCWLNSSSHCSLSALILASSLVSKSRRLAACSKSCPFTAWYFWFLMSSSCFLYCMRLSGMPTSPRCTLEPASSRASMALSGCERSVI